MNIRKRSPSQHIFKGLTELLGMGNTCVCKSQNIIFENFHGKLILDLVGHYHIKQACAPILTITYNY